MKRRRKQRWIFAFPALVGLLICGVLLINSRVVEPTFDAANIEANINKLLHENVESLYEEWRECNTRDAMQDSLWRSSTDEDFKQKGLSLFLYDNDSLKYWANNFFTEDPASCLQEPRTTMRLMCGSEVLPLNFPYCSICSNAIVMVTLMDSKGRFNPYIFESSHINPKIEPTAAPLGSTAQVINVHDTEFYIYYPTQRTLPPILNILLWLALSLMLFYLRDLFSISINSRNVMRRIVLFFGLLLLLRFTLYITEISSLLCNNSRLLSALIVNLAFFYIFVNFVYCKRHKLRMWLNFCSRPRQYCVLISFSLFFSISIIFLYESLLDYIRMGMLNTEVGNLAEIDLETILLLSASTLFLGFTITQSLILKSAFTQFRTLQLCTISVVVFMVCSLFFNHSANLSTSLTLAWFATAILTLYMLFKRLTIWFYVVMVVICSAYITYFTFAENNISYTNIVKTSCDFIEQGLEPPHSDYRNLWHATISHSGVVRSENSNYILSSLDGYFAMPNDTVFVKDNMVHAIVHTPHKTILSSMLYAGMRQAIPFFCYVSIMLFFSGLFLLWIGRIRIFTNYNKRSLLYKIRFVLLIISLSIALIIAVMVFYYFSERNNMAYRQAFSSRSIELTESFNNYMAETLTKEMNEEQKLTILKGWFVMARSRYRTSVAYFDSKGIRVLDDRHHIVRHTIPSRAFYELNYNGEMCYEGPGELRDLTYQVAYLPISQEYRVNIKEKESLNGKERIGYMAVVMSDRYSHQENANEILIDIINITLLLLVLICVISIILYQLFTKQLRALHDGLFGLSPTNKIEIKNSRPDPNDEIGSIINHYNRMVDYIADRNNNSDANEQGERWRNLARQIAHEIKNPLTPMKLKIQMLQRYGNIPPDLYKEKLKNSLSAIMEQIGSLEKLANDFSELSGTEFGTGTKANACSGAEANTSVDICTLLDNVAKLYNDHQELNFSYTKSECCNVRVWANYSALNRVMINLLKNAVEATEPSGTIHLQCIWEKPNVVIRVCDNGGGIRTEKLQDIFAANYSTKAEGMGLGLSISKSIIENAGGTISAHNEFDPSDNSTWACFTITLPAQPLS